MKLDKLLAFKDAYLATLQREATIEGGLAFNEKLEPEWFDFSLNSLYYVDGYLFSLYALKDQLDERQLQNSVWAMGFYVGEVILRNSSTVRSWQHHEDYFADKDAELQNLFPLTMGTLAVLTGEGESFTLPVSKVINFIEEGPENSLQFYADQEITTN